MMRFIMSNTCATLTVFAGVLVMTCPTHAEITYTNLFPLSAAGDPIVVNDAHGAQGSAGVQLIGYVNLGTADVRAKLWTESAPAGISLHPLSGFDRSLVYGTDGTHQVGYGFGFGIGYHALLWAGTAQSVIDLHPSTGFSDTEAHGVGGGQQVGFGYRQRITPLPPPRALLWSGTAESVVDLTPDGFEGAIARATNGTQQAGEGDSSAFQVPNHALLWSGTAASAVDLHPAGFYESRAVGLSATQQVGDGIPSAGGAQHALLWTGSVESAVDLHPAGFVQSFALATDGIHQVGYGTGAGPGFAQAFLWSGSAESFINLHALLPSTTTGSIAYSVSGDTVYGYASDSSGARYAIAWHIPEPTSLAVIFVCATVLTRRMRRIAQ
jgi:hypothetical protein